MYRTQRTNFKKELQTMFNKVILIGRLGKNAEVKTAQNKKDYAVLSIATLGNHPKAAIDYHLKTGHRETA